MYNCGICGINYQEVKDLFIKTYWDMVEEYKINGIYINGCIPDIIFEQKILHDIAKYKHQRVKELIRFEYRSKDATKLSYQHLIGDWK